MWRVDWICRRHHEGAVVKTETVDKSPYMRWVENPPCPDCKEPMNMAGVEDLRVKPKTIRRRGGFHAEQPKLF